MPDDLRSYLSFYRLLVEVARPVIITALLVGLGVALRRAAALPRAVRIATWLSVAVPLVAWFAVAWGAAVAGWFQQRVGALPVVPFAIVLPVLVGLIALTRSRQIAQALDRASPSWLVGIQVYRVIGGNFLVLWAYGALPGSFALPAGIGDVLVGVLAVPVALYVASRRRGEHVAAVAWNLLGIVDLLTAVTLGTLMTAGRAAPAATGVPNLLAAYPTVMTPAFAVPLSLILHGLSLWQTRRRSRAAAGLSAMPTPSPAHHRAGAS